METEFQELYNSYNQADKLKREKSLHKIHEYIYYYASKRFQADEDTASDFYLYIHERLFHIINEYQPG